MSHSRAPGARPRALVIGGSMSGLFAAALLRRAGWDAELYERSDVELFGRGAGIVTHDDLLTTLRRSGADLTDLGVTVEERIAIDAAGRVVDCMPFKQVVTSWDRLHQIMRATLPDAHHHLGHHLVAVEQDAHSVTAVFANGARVTGDLLVAADGFRSSIRRLYAPEIQPLYAGYVVWRGLADEAVIPRAAHAAVFDKFAFYLPPNNKNIGYPIAGANNDLRPGHRRFNWVWYRPVPAEELDDMLVGSDGVRYDVSIPPPKVRQDLIDRLRADARAFLAPPMAEILDCVERPFFTPIYDHVCPRMVFGRVALIGDAAATCRPHIGMGVAKGGSDAEVLADSLAAAGADVAAGLAAFEASRLEVAQRSVARGRDLGEYMLAHEVGPSERDSERWQEYHSVRGILKHTASSAFLRRP